MGEWIDILTSVAIEKIRNGTSDKQVTYHTEYPVTRIETISDGEIDFNRIGFVDNCSDVYLLKDGDILLSNINSLKHIGKVAFYKNEKKLYHGMNLLLLRFKDEYDKKFLYFLLSLKKNWFEKMAAQAINQASINQTTIGQLELVIPKDKSEQTRIAEILNTVDEAITHTEALIAKYQRIKTGLMQDLLTRGIDKNGTIRSKKTHKFVVKNGIEVPEEWEVDSLGTLIKAVDAQPNHRTPPSVDNGIPYLGINDIDENGNVDFKKCRKVSNSVLEEHNRRYKLRDGDIIFGKIGTIGEPKRLKAWTNITISANVILIQPHDTPDFIFWVLNSEYIQTQVKNSIHSTSQPAFGMEKIRNLIILIPPKNEREIIQNIINQNESNILTTKTHLSKLQSLKTGLMQDLLSGKVRVKIDTEN